MGKIAPELTQKGELPLGLDALCNHMLALVMAENDHCPDERVGICLGADVTHKRLLCRPRHKRKNHLFAGPDSGGHRAAILYTLIQTATLNGLDPEAYLRDLLARIADHPINRIDDLLPSAWAASPRTAAAA